MSFSPDMQIVSEIVVDVLDVNDTPPKFDKDSYSEFISENTAVGTVIAELRATDADTPANTDLVYSFSPNSVKGKALGHSLTTYSTDTSIDLVLVHKILTSSCLSLPFLKSNVIHADRDTNSPFCDRSQDRNC
jgi:hypothetical protein